MAVMSDAVKCFIAHWKSLDAIDRKRALDAVSIEYAEELERGDSYTATLLKSLRLAQDTAGREPTVADYKEAKSLLSEQGVELVSVSRIIKHFGSWQVAKEALGLSALPTRETTPLRIEARIKARRVGKIWRYTHETLSEVMAQCVTDLGRVPLVAEFETWRRIQLEDAARRGEIGAHLPSSSPYRLRWETWAQALEALGYADDNRLDRSSSPAGVTINENQLEAR